MAKPNVLLFFVDQMRADAIAALGNDEIKTPNLDRLVSSGTAFTNAFSPSPVCVPARCSLHYGMYPSASGCYDNGFPMPEDKPSFMDVLSAAGYRTHGVGKCHFSPDLLALRGFQSRLIQEEIVDDWKNDDYLKWLFADPATRHIVDPHGTRGDMYYVPQISQLSQELHPTNWVGKESLKFIDQQGDSDQPWMLFCSFIHPHPPFSPPSPWNKIYRATDVSLPKVNENCQDNYTYINRQQNRYKYRDRGIDLNLVRCMKAHYYACITFIDYQIGRILDHLEQTGQKDNTLIIFTSDHGEHLGDNNCFGKRSFHDQASRIPMLVSLPGSFTPGQICREPVSLIDIFPTMVNHAGLRMPNNCQGIDMGQIAAGNIQRDMVFSEFGFDNDSICMAVSQDWKYAYSAADQKCYLFDRQNDPDEAKNLVDHADYHQIRQKCHDRLLDFLRQSGRDDIVDDSGFKPLEKKTVPQDPDKGLLYQDMQWAREVVDEKLPRDFAGKDVIKKPGC